MNYHVARNGQQLGELSATDISLKLATGELSPQDLAWAEGMASWQEISTISGLSGMGTPPVRDEEMNPYEAPRAELLKPGTGQAALATLGQRLGAHLLDGLVLLPFGMALSLIQAAVNDPASEAAGLVMLAAPIGLLHGLIIGIYNAVLLSKKGQTIGKRWVGIRVTNLNDDGNPGFHKAFLMRSFVNFCISVFLFPIYPIVDACFIFRDDRRCLHDFIAETRVVQV